MPSKLTGIIGFIGWSVTALLGLQAEAIIWLLLVTWYSQSFKSSWMQKIECWTISFVRLLIETFHLDPCMVTILAHPWPFLSFLTITFTRWNWLIKRVKNNILSSILPKILVTQMITKSCQQCSLKCLVKWRRRWKFLNKRSAYLISKCNGDLSSCLIISLSQWLRLLFEFGIPINSGNE